jgi:hypothetical protein
MASGLFLGTLVIGIGALAIPAPGSAGQQATTSSPTLCEQLGGDSAGNTDTLMLAALVQHRAQLVQLGRGDKRAALHFLDARIAEVKVRLAACSQHS